MELLIWGRGTIPYFFLRFLERENLNKFSPYDILIVTDQNSITFENIIYIKIQTNY